MKYEKSFNNNPYSVTRETIVAQITPPGVGAVHIIRISGIRCGEIACGLLRNFFIKLGNERRMQFVTLSKSKVKDKVLATYFLAPRSYTGEDVVEISMHGNQKLVDLVIAECIKKGAVIAEPGEFTSRAFLNGKIDLTQAEGICDLINAQTESQINAAYELASGELSKIINKAYGQLINMAAATTVGMDYPEQEVDLNIAEKIETRLVALKRKFSLINGSYEGGRIIREGVRIVIVGRPNVGKSSLLNSFLQCQRAIVTDIAGTTRDIVQESYIYKNLKFVFTDTAGIHQTDDRIEILGIGRTYEAMRQADVIVFVTDKQDEDAEKEILERAKNKEVIKIYSKQDLHKSTMPGYYSVSSELQYNVEQVKEIIYNQVKEKVSGEGLRLTSARQKQGMTKCYSFICEAIDACKNEPLDIVASIITEAANCLGQLCGLTASESVIDEIFSKFCVGK